MIDPPKKGRVLSEFDKDIEPFTFKAGDYVWSENPETHEKALKKVNKIFVREKDSIIRLSINGEIIETTDEHPLPFCPKSRRRFVRQNGQRSSDAAEE